MRLQCKQLTSTPTAIRRPAASVGANQGLASKAYVVGHSHSQSGKCGTKRLAAASPPSPGGVEAGLDRPRVQVKSWRALAAVIEVIEGST